MGDEKQWLTELIETFWCVVRLLLLERSKIVKIFRKMFLFAVLWGMWESWRGGKWHVHQIEIDPINDTIRANKKNMTKRLIDAWQTSEERERKKDAHCRPTDDRQPYSFQSCFFNNLNHPDHTENPVMAFDIGNMQVPWILCSIGLLSFCTAAWWWQWKRERKRGSTKVDECRWGENQFWISTSRYLHRVSSGLGNISWRAIFTNLSFSMAPSTILSTIPSTIPSLASQPAPWY